MPVAFDQRGVHALGYSSLYNGGYADLMVVSDAMALSVPNGLDHRVAALTEPFAVGVHAVNKSRIKAGEAAIVLGCGPVGLACIAALRTLAIEPIVAADFSPRRRALAATLGAHTVVDPREEPVVDAWRRTDRSWVNRTLVVFEAVGVPGMIDQAMRLAPRNSRLVVVGVCMEHDTLWPIVGIGKELDIQFVLAYEPTEFADSLRMLAEGVVDLSPMVTAEIPVDGVPQAFADLANPEAHAKILVTP
jgi:threonine dehydrogenase-like Zn-dependent dehydrogenase